MSNIFEKLFSYYFIILKKKKEKFDETSNYVVYMYSTIT